MSKKNSNPEDIIKEYQNEFSKITQDFPID